MIFEIGNLDGLLFLIILIMLGPALVLGLIGSILLSKQKKKAGKILLILAGVYLLVSFGICGSMMV